MPPVSDIFLLNVPLPQTKVPLLPWSVNQLPPYTPASAIPHGKRYVSHLPASESASDEGSSPAQHVMPHLPIVFQVHLGTHTNLLKSPFRTLFQYHTFSVTDHKYGTVFDSSCFRFLFHRKFLPESFFRVSQKSCHGHCPHNGSPFGTQTIAPSSINA